MSQNNPLSPDDDSPTIVTSPSSTSIGQFSDTTSKKIEEIKRRLAGSSSQVEKLPPDPSMALISHSCLEKDDVGVDAVIERIGVVNDDNVATVSMSSEVIVETNVHETSLLSEDENAMPVDSSSTKIPSVDFDSRSDNVASVTPNSPKSASPGQLINDNQNTDQSVLVDARLLEATTQSTADQPKLTQNADIHESTINTKDNEHGLENDSTTALLAPPNMKTLDSDGFSDISDLSPRHSPFEDYSDPDLLDDEESRRLEEQALLVSNSMKGFLTRVKTETEEQKKTLDEKEKRATMSFLALQPSFAADLNALKDKPTDGHSTLNALTSKSSLIAKAAEEKLDAEKISESPESPRQVSSSESLNEDDKQERALDLSDNSGDDDSYFEAVDLPTETPEPSPSPMEPLPDPTEARRSALEHAPTHVARLSYGIPKDFDMDSLEQGYDVSPQMERFPSRRPTMDVGPKSEDNSVPIQPLPQVSEIASPKNVSKAVISSETSQTVTASQNKSIETTITVESVKPVELVYEEEVVAPAVRGRKPSSLLGTLSGFFRTSNPSSPIHPPLTPPPIPIDPPLHSMRRTESSSSLTAPRLNRKQSSSSLASIMTSESSAEIDLLLARLEAANKQIETDPKAARARQRARDSFSGIKREDLDWGTLGTFLFK